jgi:hypothetical protein
MRAREARGTLAGASGDAGTTATVSLAACICRELRRVGIVASFHRSRACAALYRCKFALKVPAKAKGPDVDPGLL